jgi:hypothetical protein
MIKNHSKYMVFQLVIIIIIPIILGIVTVSPFDEPIVEDPSEIEDDSKFGLFYFFLMLIWFFFLFRILFQLKKGTFNLQRKY